MTIDEIYKKIGTEIFNVIECDNWSNAILSLEYIGDGVVGYTGEYTALGENADMSVENIDDDISDWIKELHEITTEGGNNKWNRAIFSLTSEGDFDMEFVWDQALDDEIEKLSK